MSPHQIDPLPDISPFGEEVLEAFCDVAAKNAAERNETLRNENQAMHPIRDKLLTAKLTHAREELGVFKLTSYIGEDETHYSYSVTAEFPHEELRKIQLELCDIPISSFFFKFPPRLFVDGNVIKARIDFRELLELEGTLVNQQGSPEEVQDMIDGNRDAVYWSQIGAIDAATGQPSMLARLLFRGNNNPLEGSIFQLECVKISKTMVDSIASFQKVASPGPVGLYFADDLELLANAHLGHDGIRKTADDRMLLLREHESLKMARTIFQSVTISNPNEGQLFQFNLESGSVAQLLNGRDEELAWRLEPVDGTTEATVLLSALSHVEATVAGIPIHGALDARSAQLTRIHGFPGFGLHWAGYSPDFFGLEAVFTFDESSLEHIQDRHFLTRVRATLIPEDDATQLLIDDEPAAPITNMTVHLLFFQFRLDAIRSNKLELIGVDVDALVETYRQQQRDIEPQPEANEEEGGAADEEDEPAAANEQNEEDA